MRLADKRNLEGNLSCRHALSASSAHSASRLSSSRLSVSLALSDYSFTRVKRDVEVSEPFLSLTYRECKTSRESTE